MLALVQLELNNFKTYRGSHIVRFVEKFTLVTGANGTGKSNFMDGIAFAMGAKHTDLRVSRVEELVNSAKKEETMFVKIVLRMDDNNNRFFKRSVSGSNCQHYIGDKEVTFCVYEKELKALNIDVRLKNFLVFQDTIESIVMNKPNERTAIFEELSGSIQFKPEYDRLKGQLVRYEKDRQVLLKTKRNLGKVIGEMQLYRIEANEYEQLSKQHEAAQLKLMLFNLYYRKQKIKSWIVDEEKLKETIDAIARDKHALEKKLARMHERCESVEVESAKYEENLKPKEFEVKKITSDLVKIRAKKEYLEKRIGECEKSLESAKKSDEARSSNVRDLEDSLQNVRREMNKYCQQYSDTLGRDVRLSESEIKDYESLKLSVCAACAMDNQRLFILDRKYKNLKDIYDNESRKRDEVDSVIKHKRIWRDSVQERTEKFESSMTEARSNLELKRASYDLSTVKLEDLRREEQILKLRVEKIVEELGDYDEHELESVEKKEEIVVNMRQCIPGVFRRLGDMCRPIHSRYNVAVTKVLGINADAIVVDKAKTARECIQYLKDHRVGICTFLPLDQLQECRLLEHLRDIRDPPNVRLIYDVINFAPPEIAKAVFHATSNTLVCETPEDASRVAYGMSRRQNCISIDGCYYRKSGIISGGNHDLARKAKRWDLQKKQSLKAEKKNLTARLREILKTTTLQQSDLSLLKLAINQIELRLKYTEQDQKNTWNELKKVETELEDLEEKKEAIEINVTEAKSNMDRAFDAMNELKTNVDAKETEIFAEFCKRIRVESIQDYENGKRAYESRINEFDQQISRITDLLSYESDRDTKINVERWGKNLDKINGDLMLILEREIAKISLLEEATGELESSQSDYRKSVDLLNAMRKEISQLRNEIASMARKHVSLTNTLNDIRHTMEKKKAHFHAILTEAKMKGFSIVPMNDQTPSLSQTSDTFSSKSSTNSLSQTYELEANLEIDFSKLPEEYYDLESAQIGQARARLEKDIADKSTKLEAIADPQMKASQHLTLAREKSTEVNQRLQENRIILRDMSANFDAVRKNRFNKFVTFLDHVSNRADVIYKDLMRDPAAQVYLIAENPEEPYLGGIQYNCVVPRKRYQINDNLSGGEKTMAGLPLLFAIQNFEDKQPPIEILDEIDAALDHHNARRAVEYIKNKKQNQTIVISHRNEFAARVDAVIGITAKVCNSGIKSKIFTYNLTPYRER